MWQISTLEYTLASRIKDIDAARLVRIWESRNSTDVHLQLKSVTGMVNFGHPTLSQFPLSRPIRNRFRKRRLCDFAFGISKFPTSRGISMWKTSTLADTLAPRRKDIDFVRFLPILGSRDFPTVHLRRKSVTGIADCGKPTVWKSPLASVIESISKRARCRVLAFQIRNFLGNIYVEGRHVGRSVVAAGKRYRHGAVFTHLGNPKPPLCT